MSSDRQPKDHSHVLKGHRHLTAWYMEGVSLWPPPIHHRRDGRGIEHMHDRMNDVGDRQQVGLPKKGHVSVVKKYHHRPVVGPDTEGRKNLQLK
jgi:hypothetical protein